MEWLRKDKIFITTTLIVAIFLISLVGLILNPLKGSDPRATVSINGHTIIVELADTLAKQGRGLSNRSSLPPDHGMLFIFNDYQVRSFWMKDMQFNIDIVWIKDNIVVGLVADASVPTNQNIETYSSPESVNFVLELNSGAINQYNIWPGDTITYNTN